MIHIIDGNNWLRRKAEAELPLGLVRFALNEIQRMDGLPMVIWDGPNGNSKRKALYPEYKGKRQAAPDDFYRIMDLFQELLLFSKAIQIKVPGYEADDVIATVVGQMPGQRIHIHSTDLDLAIFGHPTDRQRELPCKPEELRLFKTLVGDPRDNIPGIRGFGEKSWAGLNDLDKKLLSQWFTGEEPDLNVLPLPQKLVQKLKDNEESVRTFWKIIGFFDVPNDLINQHTKIGVNNPIKANNLMMEFLL